METNSASIATKVPGFGNSSERRTSCLIKLSSRFLKMSYRQWPEQGVYVTYNEIEVSRVRIVGSMLDGKPLKSKLLCASS